MSEEFKTDEFEHPFSIDQGAGFRQAKFRAWRKGRPNVKGYGMTKEEAINDLTQNVQPLRVDCYDRNSPVNT
ncbi:MAG: hypothetical protein PHH85_01885 [Candidatus Methanoperedens sp.]|nr:hypothetical protein [Candidatus Methanoperedens sp.]